MLCQRQFGILPSFFPFIFNPVLGRACQPFGAAPHSLVRLLRPFLRFSSFTLVKSLDFVVRSFSCLSRPPLRVPHRECSVGCLSLACV